MDIGALDGSGWTGNLRGDGDDGKKIRRGVEHQRLNIHPATYTTPFIPSPLFLLIVE